MKDLSIVFIFLLTGIKCVASDAVLQYEVSRPGILCRANRYMTSFERLRIMVAKENNTGVTLINR